MASLIDPNRKERFERLKIQKRRTDKISQACFLLLCGIALEPVICLFVGISSGHSRDMIYAVFLSIFAAAGLTGCLRRNLIMSILAVIAYLAGFLLSREYQQAFVLFGLCLHLIPGCGAVYANYMEQQLRKEEGYPQFDLSPEEKALQTQFAQQTSYAALSRQKNGEEASPHDMDEI